MDFLKTFLGGAGGAAIVAGLFMLIQWRLNRKAQKEDKAAEQKWAKEVSKNEGMVEILRRMDVLFLADRTILFDRIKHLGKSYIDRGYITVEELEDLKRMHEVYHDPDKLDGNGFLDDLMYTVTHTLEIRAK
jgi:uncharacterized membrane protein